MGTIRNVILAALIAYFAYVINRFVSTLDFNKVVHYHEPGPCHLVPGADDGSEDIQRLSNGIALISSGLRLPPPGSEHTKDRVGRILKFDFNNPDDGAEEVKIINADEMLDFNPHGISIWEDGKTGEVRVFVINHPVQDEIDYICIFEYDVKMNTLRHLKCVSHPLFRVQNDVVATGPESFYTTLYATSRNMFVQLMEALFQLHWGAVVYYDGKDARVVDEGLFTPNGINKSPDGKFLYLASSMHRIIKIYRINSDNGITALRDIPVGTMIDNIDVDPQNGELWTGGHPIGYQFAQHGIDPKNGAPSQVLRIRFKGDSEFIEEVFAEPSLRVFGSSIAVRYKDAMLVGTVMHKLLYCQLKHISQ